MVICASLNLSCHCDSPARWPQYSGLSAVTRVHRTELPSREVPVPGSSSIGAALPNRNSCTVRRERDGLERRRRRAAARVRSLALSISHRRNRRILPPLRLRFRCASISPWSVRRNQSVELERPKRRFIWFGNEAGIPQQVPTGYGWIFEQLRSRFARQPHGSPRVDCAVSSSTTAAIPTGGSGTNQLSGDRD
jgi:hypothetical protein